MVHFVALTADQTKPFELVVKLAIRRNETHRQAGKTIEDIVAFALRADSRCLENTLWSIVDASIELQGVPFSADSAYSVIGPLLAVEHSRTKIARKKRSKPTEQTAILGRPHQAPRRVFLAHSIYCSKGRLTDLAGRRRSIDSTVRNQVWCTSARQGQSVRWYTQRTDWRSLAQNAVVRTLRENRCEKEGQYEYTLHRMQNIIMNSSQGSKISNKGRNLLSKAGQLTLAATSQPTLLQEVNDDEEFAPIGNITTTYLDVQGNSTPVHRSNPTSKVSFSRAAIPKQKDNDFQYSRITAQLRNNAKAQAKSIEKKRQEKLKHFMEGEEELDGVEHIIGQIQQLVSHGLEGDEKQISFKNRGQRPQRNKKKNWQTKGINTFNSKQHEAFSKLEELLLNYKLEQPKVKQIVNNVKESPGSLSDRRQERRRRRQERQERNKKYRDVQQDINETNYIQKSVKKQKEIQEEPAIDNSQSRAEKSAVPDPEQQYQQQFEVKEPQQSSVEPQKENLLKLQDIELVQLEWQKLPIILSPLSPQNSQLFLRLRDYPEDQTFLDAIIQTLGQQQYYTSYSIFDCKKTAGLKNNQLLSEEEFRQIWAEQWQHDVEDESTKQMLCEYDFQWYRSLVQLTYSHSLEQILMKDIKYDSATFMSNLRKINGGSDDKNKAVDHLNITDRIMVNKLKYIDALLAKFSRDKNSGQKGNVVVGIVPSVSHSSPEQKQLVKQEVQKMFIGGLYATQNDHNMAVVIPLQMAHSGKVERISAGLVKIGQVSMLINNTQSQGEGPKLSIKYEKLKNSMVRIAVHRPGDEQYVLEVGEELHCGRRYKILLD